MRETNSDVNSTPNSRIELINIKLQELINAISEYQKSLESRLNGLKDNEGKLKVMSVLEWQKDITEELVETLENDILKVVIRITEQDFILSQSDINDILV